MASETHWANRALSKIGDRRILALSDDNAQARLLNSMFESVRQDELRARKWSFSIKRAMLAADVATPAFGYGRQYTLPNDCLRVLTLFSFDVGPDMSDYQSGNSGWYTIEGRKILYGRPIPGGPVSAEPMPLRYIADAPDTTVWDPSFGEAFACRLAAEVAEQLTQSSDKRRLAWQEYEMAVRKAKRANALELPSQSINDDTWISARLRG